MKVRNITPENITLRELFNFIEIYKKYLSENNLEHDTSEIKVNSLIEFVQDTILPNIIH